MGWDGPSTCRVVTKIIQALLDVCSEELQDARVEPEPDSILTESREYVDSLDVEPEPVLSQAESREYDVNDAK